MKFCNICGEEIFTKDGDNTCPTCEDAKERTRAKRRALRREKEAMLRACGLVKVRGAMGGVYWE